MQVSRAEVTTSRYIGECTRLVFDIMNYTEKHNLPGMLILSDFEKAFDSISWTFIYKTLEFFWIWKIIFQLDKII